MDLSEISGPTLIIDKQKCLSNIERINNKVNSNKLIFRPHFKTHQSHEIGRWFRDFNIDKITVSSLKMAYYFAADGWNDILVGLAYNPREYIQYEAIGKTCNLSLTICSEESAKIFAKQCRFGSTVMIKIDTGYNRTGIKWNNIDSIKRTVENLRTNKHISIRGLMTHDGSTYGLKDTELIINQYYRSVERINFSKKESGLDELIISAGDTPSASLIDSFKHVDELRPGNFIFYDLMQYTNGSCSFEDIAITALCPVIDIRPESQNIIIHGGAVHLSKESINIEGKNIYGMVAGLDGKGWFLPEDEIYISSLSQEHGIINLPKEYKLNDYRIGDLLAVIPVHSCLSADCMGGYLSWSGEKIDHMRGN